MEGRSGDDDVGGETTILVSGRKVEGTGYDDEKRRHYDCIEFHKVDLKDGKVEKNCYPDLLIWEGIAEMVQAGRKLYVFGGLCEDKDVDCASILDLDKKDCGWKQVPLPFTSDYRISPRCASYDGKIYIYPNEFRISDDVRLSDDDDGLFEYIWSPPEVAHRGAGVVVSDPGNQRILVNISNIFQGKLYAFYPRDRTMKPVADVLYWYEAVALADDVAYVHGGETSKILYAFDLSQRPRELNVTWTSTVLEDTIDGVFYLLDLRQIEFNRLFHVGNNNFWFAVWNPETRYRARLIFVKFKLHREEDKIMCTPLAMRLSPIEPSCTIYDFLLLQ